MFWCSVLSLIWLSWFMMTQSLLLLIWYLLRKFSSWELNENYIYSWSFERKKSLTHWCLIYLLKHEKEFRLLLMRLYCMTYITVELNIWKKQQSLFKFWQSIVYTEQLRTSLLINILCFAKLIFSVYRECILMFWWFV